MSELSSLLLNAFMASIDLDLGRVWDHKTDISTVSARIKQIIWDNISRIDHLSRENEQLLSQNESLKAQLESLKLHLAGAV